eukprot:352375-Chlamydomonas_euryale.AAC.1
MQVGPHRYEAIHTVLCLCRHPSSHHPIHPIPLLCLPPFFQRPPAPHSPRLRAIDRGAASAADAQCQISHTITPPSSASVPPSYLSKLPLT